MDDAKFSAVVIAVGEVPFADSGCKLTRSKRPLLTIFGTMGGSDDCSRRD